MVNLCAFLGDGKKGGLKMNKEQKRNVWGMVVCFVLCCLFGCWGLAVMVLREVWQSDKGGFPVEKDDLVRYCFAGFLGYVVNVVLLLTLC